LSLEYMADASCSFAASVEMLSSSGLARMSGVEDYVPGYLVAVIASWGLIWEVRGSQMAGDGPDCVHTVLKRQGGGARSKRVATGIKAKRSGIVQATHPAAGYTSIDLLRVFDRSIKDISEYVLSR
jgi:hypothetical protein